MKKIIGLNAKGLKVLANRIAKMTNCDVLKNDSFVKSYSLVDNETKDFFINIPELGEITGMPQLSVRFDKDGYTVEETSEYVVSNKNYNHKYNE